jgi:hypothetical protein
MSEDHDAEGDEFQEVREATYVEETEEMSALIRRVADSQGRDSLQCYPRVKQIVSGYICSIDPLRIVFC